MGLLVTVELSEYTTGNVNLRVSFNGRASASQADDVGSIPITRSIIVVKDLADSRFSKVQLPFT